MLCSEIETSSLSHPLSPYYLSSSPLFFRFPPISRTSLPIYLPVSVCIFLTHPISFCFSHMACHLCDKWTSFFSGNSLLMDFSLLLCVCAVFLPFPSFLFPHRGGVRLPCEIKTHFSFPFFMLYLLHIISKSSNADGLKKALNT